MSRHQHSPTLQHTNGPARQPCRVETLSRDLFTALLRQGVHGVSTGRLAEEAIEAAEVFYETWDQAKQPR